MCYWKRFIKKLKNRASSNLLPKEKTFELRKQILLPKDLDFFGINYPHLEINYHQSSPPRTPERMVEPKKMAFKNNLFVPYQKALKFGLSVITTTLPEP